MKTIKLLIYCTLLILSASLSYGQSLLWGRQGIDHLKSDDFGTWVAADNKGNAYLCGEYNSAEIFGSDTLTANGDNAYIVKYDASGTVLWAAQPSERPTVTNASYGFSDATDENGNVFLTGTFSDTISFGAYTLYANTTQQVFLTKYNTNGTVIWAKQTKGSSGSAAQVYSVCTDKAGNSYITGYFTDTLQFGSTKLYSSGTYNVFLAKYDPNGNVLWVKQSITNSSFIVTPNTGYSVATDKAGNAYVTGAFSDTVSFGAFPLKGDSINPSVFLVKYDALGNVLWARQDTGFSYGYSVTTDKADNAYITGYYSSPSATFGSITLNTSLSQDVFLVKYSGSGNVLWAKDASGGTIWTGYSLSSDVNNHIYLAGTGGRTDSLMGTKIDTIIMGGSLFHDNSPASSYAAFMIKFDTSGTALCGSVLRNGSEYTGVWEGCASDSTGTFTYLAGTFDDTLVCGANTLNASGTINPYLTRWNACNEGEGIDEVSDANAEVGVYPNPNNGVFTLQVESEKLKGQSRVVEIYNMLGEKIYSQLLIPNSQFLIDLSARPNGIYLYRVISETGKLIGDGKLIISK